MKGILLQGEIGEDINLDAFKAKQSYILNSPGGDLFTGFSMYDFNLANGVDVGVIGVCGSSATFALLGSVTAWGTPNSRYLIHNPTGSINGDAREMKLKSEALIIEENKILDIYEKHLKGDREQIRAWMFEAKLWDAETALERGLITEIKNENKTSKTPEGSDIANIFNQFKNSIGMKEQDKEQLSGISTKLDKLITNMGKFFKPKNVMIQDTNGVELDFYETDTPEQIEVGVKATADGEPAEGEFVVTTGSKPGVYVFTAGELTEIKPPKEEGGDEDMEALKAENAALTQQLADVQNKVTVVTGERDGLQNSLKDMSTQVNAISSELTTFKNKFSDDKAPITVPSKDKTTEKKKFSYKKK